MISKEMLELLFRPASMQRWNDHIRPHTGFSELDKQAHKMVFAYVLAKTEESDRGQRIEWQQLIEGGIFEFLQRSVLTDLKPDVFHKLMDQKSQELNGWVIEQTQSSIAGIEGGFLPKLHNYLYNPKYSLFEKRILKASHYLATSWEFEIIHHLNKGFFGLEQTSQNIANEVEEFYDLAGVQKFMLGKKTNNFMDLVGQLRFQQCWAQSPRVPETSVLGHMLIVAMISYLFSVEMGAGEKRIYNNFFAALFHDLPEVLTRDIISPVKRSVEGLEDIIKTIEKVQLEEKILPLLPRGWHREMLYFLEDEFLSKAMLEGEVLISDSEQISREFDSDDYNPLDGELVRMCDQLAAYIEASMSIAYGIKAPEMMRGKGMIYDKYARNRVGGIDFQTYFDYFAED
jgi:putative hydrolase of HD superfamily